ncbi:MAG: ABC transporter substrate-binding protein [Spirochaetales bacterium]|nr:ABC transporter substrate-binding protein [Spirochaetales bacterium]
MRYAIPVLLMLLTAAVGVFPGGQHGDDGRPPTVRMVLIFDEAPDSDDVVARLNEMTLRDLGARVEVEYLGADWQTKYKLLLTAGEHVDLIFTANWAFYNDMVTQGAFMDLDDLIREHAPRTYAEISPDVWDHARRDGRIYMVPKNDVYYDTKGILYRLDWARAAGLGRIDDADEFYEYLRYVRATEDIPPLVPDRASGFLTPLRSFMMSDGSTFEDPLAFGDFFNNLVILDYDDYSLRPIWEDQPSLEALEFLRRAYTENLIPLDAMVSSVTTRDLFEIGRAAAFAQNPIASADAWRQIQAQDPDILLDWIYADHVQPIVPMKSPAVAGMAIPISAEYPDIAMQLLELLHQEEEYNALLTYGIRGVHWDFDEAGRFGLPEGVEANEGYPWDKQNPWGFREAEFHYTHPMADPSTPEVIREAWAAMERYDEFLVHSGFGFDKSAVSAEYAACENVKAQYFDPMLYGVLEVEAGMAELRERLDQAGWERVFAELQRQWSAFLAAGGRTATR